MGEHIAKNSPSSPEDRPSAPFGWPGLLPPAHVMLSHSRFDERDRAVRLRRVAVPLACSAVGTFGRLLRLHDHKGTLEVHWRSRPEYFDRRLVEFLWAEQVEYSVRHYLDRRCIHATEYDGPVAAAHYEAPTPANPSDPVGLSVLSREEALMLDENMRAAIR